MLETLPLIQDAQLAGEQLHNILPVARESGLSAHDTVYQELSKRYSAPLAKLDGWLREVAPKSGVETFVA